ncbi:MAG: mannose-6-phosphate isomerase, class I [Polyangiaceae bacterium]
MIDKLECGVMPYAWGSKTAIAALRGLPASTAPEAELWMGAHPALPSRLRRDGAHRSLIEVIDADPHAELGRAAAQAFDGRLPFLLKVLAADSPLSLQVHPDANLARAGFEAEESARVPRSAAHRNYRDASHKPELLCALGPFEALSGFRPAAEIAAVFAALGVAQLEAFAARLRREPSAIAEVFRALMTMEARAALVEDVARSAKTLPAELRADAELVERLVAIYPGDVGVIGALMLNRVELSAGEAIYLGAGQLHAYLGGVGVEIMASSDNVLRGGLTPKHVDVPELMRALDFEPRRPDVLSPRALDTFERLYDTPAREFALSVIRSAGAELTRSTSGPELLLVTEGVAQVRSANGVALELARGEVAFVSGRAAPSYSLRGAFELFRARVP